MKQAKIEEAARKIVQDKADEEARKKAAKQREIDEAVQRYLATQHQSASSRPVVGSSHSSAAEPTYVSSPHSNSASRHNSHQHDPNRPHASKTVNINYNVNASPKGSRRYDSDYSNLKKYKKQFE